MRELRKKEADPANWPVLAVKRLAKKCRANAINDEYQQRLEALVIEVKAKIDAFNQSAVAAR
jgi:hypothetical protein